MCVFYWSRLQRDPKQDYFCSFRSAGPGVKYRCAQRAGSTRQWCERFCSTVAKRGQYGWQTVFNNDIICHILHMRHRDCLPTSIPSQLVQSRFRWFGHATRRPDGEVTNHLLLPTPPRTWRRRVGGQLKMGATTIKADLEQLYGPRAFDYARWRNDWALVFNELAQDRRAWRASIRDVVSSIGDAGQIRPG